MHTNPCPAAVDYLTRCVESFSAPQVATSHLSVLQTFAWDDIAHLSLAERAQVRKSAVLSFDWGPLKPHNPHNLPPIKKTDSWKEKRGERARWGVAQILRVASKLTALELSAPYSLPVTQIVRVLPDASQLVQLHVASRGQERLDWGLFRELPNLKTLHLFNFLFKGRPESIASKSSSKCRLEALSLSGRFETAALTACAERIDCSRLYSLTVGGSFHKDLDFESRSVGRDDLMCLLPQDPVILEFLVVSLYPQSERLLFASDKPLWPPELKLSSFSSLRTLWCGPYLLETLHVIMQSGGVKEKTTLQEVFKS